MTEEKYAQPLKTSWVSSAKHSQNQIILATLFQTIQMQQSTPHLHTKGRISIESKPVNDGTRKGNFRSISLIITVITILKKILANLYQCYIKGFICHDQIEFDVSNM